MASYRVFTRAWYKLNPVWPDGLEPDGTGIKRTLAVNCTIEQARGICKEWNGTHDPGELSRKAEFEEE